MEDSAAWTAVRVRLSRVLVQSLVGAEDGGALRALEVLLLVVLLQILAVVKVAVAERAEGVRCRVDEMRLERRGRIEIAVAPCRV